MTLDEIILRNSLRFPDKPALVADDVARTWAQLEQRVGRLAAALAGLSPAPQSRIAVLLPNCPEYLEIYFACARAGVIAVPVNYRLTEEEMSAILRHAEPALFIVAGEYRQRAQDALRLAGGSCPLWQTGADYEQAIATSGYQPADTTADDNRACAIFYTSGTTGLPKGAMISHGNLEMNGYNQIIADAATGSDINLVSTPIYHVGAVFMAVTYMMLGCTQVILRRFAPTAWLRSLAETRATVALLIPTMINSILNDPELPQTDLGHLRLVFYGGGPMPPAVLDRAMASLRCDFTQGYGLTETLEATFLTRNDHVRGGSPVQQRRLASAGREAVGAQVRIVDDDDRELPPGEVGEILVRSRSVISGYWKMPDETARAIRGGWFYTGDLGFLDEDRYLFVVDRKKDMVVSGGVNIYTKEIEAVLYEHPAVQEAAVIGMPDEHWGEQVTAIVAVRPGLTVSADELIVHCRTHLTGFKKPRQVFFLDELPKNPSGKILKREIRQMLGGTMSADNKAAIK